MSGWRVPGTGAAGPGEDGMPPQGSEVDTFLEGLGEERVPRDLAAAVITGVRARPGRRPSFRLPALAAAAGALAVIAIAMASGWRPPFDLVPGPGGGSPTPSSAVVTPSPSLEPETNFEFARIAVAGADRRTDAAYGLIIAQTSDSDIGRIVLVRERKTVADRTWVKVEEETDGAGARFTWLPETIPALGAGGGEVQVLEQTGLGCVGGDDVGRNLDYLAGLTGAERLACVGGRDLTLGPTQVIPITRDSAYAGTPGWLAGPVGHQLAAGLADGMPLGMLDLRVDPSRGVVVPPNSWVTIHAHLGDAAAAGCTRTPTGTDLPVGDARDQVLWCRQQLVLDGYEVVSPPTPGPTPVTPTMNGEWRVMPDAPLLGRVGNVAVWTGSELVIWGGEIHAETAQLPGRRPDGAAYDPVARTWRAMSGSPLAARSGALATWTGTEVLIWGGGATLDGRWLADGAAWNPTTNRWRLLSAAPLTGAFRRGEAWTGAVWLVGSGDEQAGYDPARDTWTDLGALPTIDEGQLLHMTWVNGELAVVDESGDGTALYTQHPGSPWIQRTAPPLRSIPPRGVVFDGNGLFAIGAYPGDDPGNESLQAVATWDQATDTWTGPIDSPVTTEGETAVWTWQHLVVIGGASAALDPGTREWSLVPYGPDRIRDAPSVVWADGSLFVWGGGQGETTWTLPDGYEVLWDPPLGWLAGSRAHA